MTLYELASQAPALLAHLGHSGPLFALIMGALLLPLIVVFVVLARRESAGDDHGSDG